MKLVISIVASLMLMLSSSFWAVAQETLLTPQTTGGSIATKLEADILQGFFSALDQATQSDNMEISVEDIVSDVLKTVVNADGATTDDEEDSGDDNEESDDVDEDQDDNGKSKSKKKKNKSKDKKKKKNKDKSSKGRGNGLPPGLEKQLAKNGSLPPGLQKKLEESGALPKGLQASALPPELEAQLPQLPDNQKRVIVDNDVLIIEEVTGQVLDAIPDIIPSNVADILKQLPGIMLPQE